MKELSLVHLVREPLVKEEHPPLLLLLHGVGSNEEDLYGLVPYLDKRFLIVSARAPITLEPGSYAWFELTFTPQGPIINPAQAEASRKKLIDLTRRAGAARRDYRRTEKGAPDERQCVADQPSPSQQVAGEELLVEFRKRLSEEERQLADQRSLNLDWA